MKKIIILFLFTINLFLLVSCSIFRSEDVSVSIEDFYNGSNKYHLCDYSQSKWYYDETNHWQMCSCGEKGNVLSHNWNEFYEFEYDSNKTIIATKRSCQTCGYIDIQYTNAGK